MAKLYVKAYIKLTREIFFARFWGLWHMRHIHSHTDETDHLEHSCLAL